MKPGKLQVGRALDALVAEKVMGWLPHTRNSAYYATAGAVNSVGEGFATQMQANINDWRPSADIAAAWQLVDKVAMFKFCDITQYDEVWVIDNVVSDWRVEAETAPLAICLAALRMVAA